MFKKLVKNPLFLIGSLFIVLLLAASFIHTFVFDGYVRQVQILYDKDGRLIDGAPIAPTWEIPFGTDRLGYDILMNIILGAKYTIIFALLIAFLRVAIAFLFGMIYGSYLAKFKRYVEGVTDSFHYIPVSLLAFYILHPVLWEGPEGFMYSLTERITIEVIVLTILALPIVSVLIGNETGQILKQEFIDGAKVLGGSRFHLIKRHVMPHLFPRLVIIFGQQVIQVLLVFAHLGLFSLFFGGTDVSYNMMMPDPPKSLSGEWSGLIGFHVQAIRTAPWIAFFPILFFGLTILAVNFMLEGYKKTLNDRSGKAEIASDQENEPVTVTDRNQFSPIEKSV